MGGMSALLRRQLENFNFTSELVRKRTVWGLKVGYKLAKLAITLMAHLLSRLLTKVFNYTAPTEVHDRCKLAIEWESIPLLMEREFLRHLESNGWTKGLPMLV